jgi:hypothetical protein
LVDARDSKSRGVKPVPVRFRPPAPPEPAPGLARYRYPPTCTRLRNNAFSDLASASFHGSPCMRSLNRWSLWCALAALLASHWARTRPCRDAPADNVQAAIAAFARANAAVVGLRVAVAADAASAESTGQGAYGLRCRDRPRRADPHDRLPDDGGRIDPDHHAGQQDAAGAGRGLRSGHRLRPGASRCCHCGASSRSRWAVCGTCSPALPLMAAIGAQSETADGEVAMTQLVSKRAVLRLLGVPHRRCGLHQPADRQPFGAHPVQPEGRADRYRQPLCR